MARQYRKFDEDFKQGAVQLVTRDRASRSRRWPGSWASTRARWATGAPRPARAAGDGNGELSESERAELARLRKEIVELRMQRDVLKRSVALWVDEAMGR